MGRFDLDGDYDDPIVLGQCCIAALMLHRSIIP